MLGSYCYFLLGSSEPEGGNQMIPSDHRQHEPPADGCSRRYALQVCGFAALGLILPRLRKSTNKLSGTVDIVYPVANQRVPGGGSFQCYGYYSGPGPLKAFVSDDDLQWNGTATTPPAGSPPYNFCFNFSRVELNQ